MATELKAADNGACTWALALALAARSSRGGQDSWGLCALILAPHLTREAQRRNDGAQQLFHMRMLLGEGEAGQHVRARLGREGPARS